MGAAEYSIRPLRAGDLEALAATMRAGDAAEVRACGLEPLAALRDSVARSRLAMALELGGELAAAFGVAEGPRVAALGPVGYFTPWLLTAAAVERHRVSFVKASRAVLAALREEYPLLVALIDSRYTRALQWAWHMGAHLGDAVPMPPSGLPFTAVVWKPEEVH